MSPESPLTGIQNSLLNLAIQEVPNVSPVVQTDTRAIFKTLANKVSLNTVISIDDLASFTVDNSRAIAALETVAKILGIPASFRADWRLHMVDLDQERWEKIATAILQDPTKKRIDILPTNISADFYGVYGPLEENIQRRLIGFVYVR